jgi:cell division protein FtsI/penicillin-binding protein 2
MTARTTALAAAAAIAAATLTACSGDDDIDDTDDSGGGAAAAPIATLARAWSAGDPKAFGAATDASGPAREAYAAMSDELLLTKAEVTPSGEPDCTDDGCTQTLSVAATLDGLGEWTYDTQVTTVADGDTWLVHWEPAVLHPKLTATTAFERSRTLPKRAPILDHDGRQLTSYKAVYRIGVVPGKAKPSSYPALADLLDVDGEDLRARADASEPDWFVDVITLRESDYRPVRDRLLQIPGVSVDPGRLPLAPTSEWGRAVLGSVGPATAESLKTAGPLATATDVVGSSGLQAAYEKELAGSPGGGVSLVDADSGRRQAMLWRVRPQYGKPVRTTLDYRFQDAAERALAGQSKTTVLVAVDARTGEILADANGPETTSYNTGFVGQYPPGSTFKTVSVAALIAAGQDIDEPADCPSTTVVDGKRFKNYEFTSLPSGSTFADAIAASCNTTVVDRADRLGNAAMHDAATDWFGIGAEWDLPLDAYPGSVPPSTSLVDKAASMIGQGRVLMSPLGMALVAAAIDSGQARTPSLIPGEGGEPVGDPLPDAAADDLRRIMRMVVTQGTASSLRGLPGGVAAKTGTAEYGTADPPRTHGWMIGYRGDVAFACLVVDGEGGNSDAGPVVRRFLELAPSIPR